RIGRGGPGLRTYEEILSVPGGKASRHGSRRLEYHERRRLVLLEQEISAKRLYIVNAKAAAHRGLAILERVPGESHTRLKVVEGGVRVIRAHTAASSTRLRRYSIGCGRVEL